MNYLQGMSTLCINQMLKIFMTRRFYVSLWKSVYVVSKLQRTNMQRVICNVQQGQTRQKSHWYKHEFSIQYKKRISIRYIDHFKSDLINNMDHLRILGNEPSSMILIQT